MVQNKAAFSGMEVRLLCPSWDEVCLIVSRHLTNARRFSKHSDLFLMGLKL
jgi:hypothetical protein